jgi:phosphatidylserine synthase
LLSGAIFILSLVLASGVWSGTGRLFEVLYVFILHIGPLHHIPAKGFIGLTSTSRPEFFLPLSLALIAFAIPGRVRQIRS